MPFSWWDLGEGSGFSGQELELWRITCPFCMERGHFENVCFEDVREYSGVLPDLAGFTTDQDSMFDIAKEIAAAVLVDDYEAP